MNSKLKPEPDILVNESLVLIEAQVPKESSFEKDFERLNAISFQRSIQKLHRNYQVEKREEFPSKIPLDRVG